MGTTVLVLALLTTLAFTLASGLVAHLSLTTAAENRERALEVAESAAALAVAAIMNDPQLAAGVLRVSPSPGCEGVVSFDLEGEVPPSTNNLHEPVSVEGSGGARVPAFTARLVALGSCRGTRELIEVMLRLPTLPALGCEGRLEASGGLLVASVEEFAQVAPAVLDPSAPRLPADLFSNLAEEDAIRLGSPTQVAGDIHSAGGVTLPDDARVAGEVRTQAEPVPIMDIAIEEFDPVRDGLPFVDLTWTPDPNPTFSGRVRRSGDLAIEGNLTLQSALLYVDGDLVVRGAVTGRGGLVATGSITVEQGSDLQNGAGVAVLAGGDVTLSGLDRRGSFLQGVVYARGNLAARRLTVVGAALCRSSELRVEEVNVIALPDSEGLPETQPLTLAFTDGTTPYDFPVEIHAVPEGTTVTFKSPFYDANGQPVMVTKPALFAFVYDDKTVPVADTQQVRDMLRDFFTAHTGARGANHLGQLHMAFNTGDVIKCSDNGMYQDAVGAAGGLPGAQPGLRQVLNTSQSQFQATGGQVVALALDPNTFLRWEDRLRVALWRRL